MFAYLVRRLGLSVALLAVTVLGTFLLHEALPGDPAAAVLGKQFKPEEAHEMRERWGLNDPLPQQFGRYVTAVAAGDLGKSNTTEIPVVEELKRVLPATVELSLCALFLATLLGITLGVTTACRPRSWWDLAGLTTALAGVSLPIFWLGLLVILAFATGGFVPRASQALVDAGYLFESLNFTGLPKDGRFDPGKISLAKYVAATPSATGCYWYDTLFVARDPGAFWHVVRHLVLPSIVLSSVPMAVIARITRAAVGDALLQDYIRTARAKGLSAGRVVAKHALRNAAIPVVTSIGTQLGYLLGGAVLTETVFSWPGMGRYMVDAIINLDIKPLQGCVLVVAVGFVIVNLLVDLSYGLLDPRVRSQGGGA